MLEVSGNPNFSEEAVRTQRPGQFGMQHFECDEPIVLQVAREIHGSHTAAAKLALEHVAIAQGCSEGIVNCYHRDRQATGDPHAETGLIWAHPPVSPAPPAPP